MAIPAHSEICQNGTFWPVDEIWKIFGPNDFIWSGLKEPGSYECLERLEDKIRKCLFFYVKIF